MSDFKGFVFKDPNSESNDSMNELSFKFSQISATDRLANFKNSRSPLSAQTASETQAKRRQKALELQKQYRYISISKARQLALGGNVSSDSSDEEEEEEETDNSYSQKRRRDSDWDTPMTETKIIKVEQKKKKNKKKFNIYANRIMYAETMEIIPEDLYENWILMICPKGKRCFVTSGGGQTIARSRGGSIINRFQSILPSGSRQSRSSDFCILDCVYDPVHWTFYVLDIMCWKGYSVFDCDTNFRHYWLQSRVEPNEFDRPNGENQFYRFQSLKPIELNQLSKVTQDPKGYITSQGYTYDIDGLLFYHKETRYTGGSTPLVCWVPYDQINSIFP